MASLTVQQTRKLSPSRLARLIVCPAYVPSAFNAQDRFRFQALHAITVLRVIARHIRQGFQLKSIERRGSGFRVDLEFLAADGRLRASEVKSAREFTEVHRIQAAHTAATRGRSGSHMTILKEQSRRAITASISLPYVSTRIFLRCSLSTLVGILMMRPLYA